MSMLEAYVMRRPDFQINEIILTELIHDGSQQARVKAIPWDIVESQFSGTTSRGSSRSRA